MASGHIKLWFVFVVAVTNLINVHGENTTELHGMSDAAFDTVYHTVGAQGSGNEETTPTQHLFSDCGNKCRCANHGTPVCNQGMCAPCACPSGFFGTHCRHYVEMLSPSYGPIAGGTKIVFELKTSLEPPPSGISVTVLIGSKSCSNVIMIDNRTTDGRNDTLVQITALTPPANVSLISKPQVITLRVGSQTLNLTNTFSYKGNPVITGIEPRETIISGGTTLTVSGENLDSVSSPIMTLDVYYESKPVSYYECPCSSTIATTMLCVTSPLSVFDSDGNIKLNETTSYNSRFRRDILKDAVIANRVKRAVRDFFNNDAALTTRRRSLTRNQTVQVKNNGNIVIKIGFILDGFEDFKDLAEALPEQSTLVVYVDPTISRWTETHTLKRGETLFLDVNGERLSSGLRETDYKVKIGDLECSRIVLYDNRLQFRPPSHRDMFGKNDTGKDVYDVYIHAGNIKFNVGQVEYLHIFSTIAIAIFGGIGGGTLLVICLIALCARSCGNGSRSGNYEVNKFY